MTNENKVQIALGLKFKCLICKRTKIMNEDVTSIYYDF